MAGKVPSIYGLAAAAVAALAGCASSGVQNPSGMPVTEMRPDERGFVAGTGVESQDLVAVTDKMARSILNVRQISNAQGTPRIVLDPVKNETRFPIIISAIVILQLPRNSVVPVRADLGKKFSRSNHRPYRL